MREFTVYIKCVEKRVHTVYAESLEEAEARAWDADAQGKGKLVDIDEFISDVTPGGECPHSA